MDAANSRFTVSSQGFEPAYLTLYRAGELQSRALESVKRLKDCKICPHNCGINRLNEQTAACSTGRYAKVSAYLAHRGEEDCLRGWNGSGTIFFSSCNLRCVFCQNHITSQIGKGQHTKPEQLAEMMLELQSRGCHNINLVTPEHVSPQILEALVLAVQGGLHLPIAYNTSAYDSLETLRLLDGIVDIYVPDFKLWNADTSLRYLKARDYPAVARETVKEMHRQVGVLKVDERGLAKRGVLVRHLVMPGLLNETEAIMRFLAQEISPDTYVNIMDQYYPTAKVNNTAYSEIDQHVTRDEHLQALDLAMDAGIHRIYKRKRFVSLLR